jgi:hypothetical protein
MARVQLSRRSARAVQVRCPSAGRDAGRVRGPWAVQRSSWAGREAGRRRMDARGPLRKSTSSRRRLVPLIYGRLINLPQSESQGVAKTC